jgi:hypothetical protein
MEAINKDHKGDGTYRVECEAPPFVHVVNVHPYHVTREFLVTKSTHDLHTRTYIISKNLILEETIL